MIEVTASLFMPIISDSTSEGLLDNYMSPFF